MPLTPADVHNITFHRSPPWRPGYVREEVDSFLELVEAEVARMSTELLELRGKLERCERLHGGPGTSWR